MKPLPRYFETLKIWEERQEKKTTNRISVMGERERDEQLYLQKKQRVAALRCKVAILHSVTIGSYG